MQIEPVIESMLKGSEAIKAIVGNRVYPGEVPQGAGFPRIVWSVIGSQPELSHQGRNPSCDRCIIAVHAVAKTAEEARKLAQTIDALFDPAAAVPVGIGVVLKDDEYTQAEFTGSAGDDRIRTVVQQYIVWAA